MIKANHFYKTKDGIIVLIKRRNHPKDFYYANTEYDGMAIEVIYNKNGIALTWSLDKNKINEHVQCDHKSFEEVCKDLDIVYPNAYNKATKIMESLQ